MSEITESIPAARRPWSASWPEYTPATSRLRVGEDEASGETLIAGVGGPSPAGR